MATRNQDSLYNLIESKLNDNSYGVTFDTDLFSTGTMNYFTVDDLGQKHRFCPVMITDIIGEYINVPNTNSTSNNVGITFDIYQDKETELNDKEVEEFSNVDYTNTLNAIEEFKNSLQAKYFPLGTPYLFMGGEDSSIVVETASAIDLDRITISFKPYNTDEENLIYFYAFPATYLSKTSSEIVFTITTGTSISIPYSVNEQIDIVITKDDDDLWTITDGTNTDSETSATVINVSKTILGYSTGIECLLYSYTLGNDIDGNGDGVSITTWDSKDTITNSGFSTIEDGTISNCILWSEDGNAIFSFNTLNPITDSRLVDGQYFYQTFELEMTVFISNDLLFGNNFEYYLDGIQVYPIDRQHTLGTEVSSAQMIDGNYHKHIIEESAREHSLSFYYIPTKQLTKLLKHIVSGSVEQNKAYELKVQYPFFNVTYDVLLNSGGTEPNINTLSSFSVTFKRKNEALDDE